MNTRTHDCQSTLAARIAEQELTSSAWQPVLYRLAEEEGRRALRSLLDEQGRSVRVYDTILLQVRDLLRSRHPSHTFTASELDSLTGEHLAGLEVDAYGVWAWYPWSGRLAHLLDEAEFVELRTNRNHYKITSGEQAELAGKRVGVVGLSVGQSAAVALALERSFGELRLADFDTLDLSNLNRIRAGVHSLGVSKVNVTAREVAEIDPFLKLTVFPQGISPENVESFLLGGGKLDVIIEECDSLDIKVLIRHHARRHRIPVVMDTSDRGMLDIERFDLEPDRPLFHGMAGDLQAGTLARLTTEEKIPYVLRIIGAEKMSLRLRSSMVEIGSTLLTWPQLGSAVALGGAAAADAARRIMLGQDRKSGRFYLDPEGFGPEREHRSNVLKEEVAERREAPAASTGSETSLVRKLVSDAILAPSGGNTQPWQWIAADDEIRLLLDPCRASLVDFESSGDYVSLGCAAENFVLAAHAAGREVELRTFPPGGGPQHAASFCLSNSQDFAEPHWRDELYSQIPLRHTQRNLGRYRTLTKADLTSLTEAVRSVREAEIEWIVDDTALEELGKLAGAADRLRIMDPRMHRDLFKEIRWNSSEAESSRDGIDVETLGLTAADRAGFELCRDWSVLEPILEPGGGGNLEKMARKQMAAASGVGLIAMPRSGSIDYFNGGRALQRMWLAATERGVAIHPMTALPYFFARLIRGGGRGFSQRMIEELRGLRERYEAIFRLAPGSGEILLFRIGFADPARVRSLRRPVGAVLSTCRSVV